MNHDDLEFIAETIRSCWTEIEAMERTYDDYCVAGHLEEQVEQALEMLEAVLERR
jgi:hypothetical protein